MKSYTLKVIDVVRETKDSITIIFKQPALKKIHYKAGQYLTLIIRINGRRYARPYSFSSSPRVDSNISITVKRISGGIVSNHIFNHVQVGNSIEVLEPLGEFNLDQKVVADDNQLVFWGVGSGITPLISIIKEVLVFHPQKKVTLVYGNKNFDSVIFLDVLAEFETKYPQNFHVLHYHTEKQIKKRRFNMFEGRIQPGKIVNALLTGSPGASVHYICGPADLKQTIRETLDTFGVPASNIFSEDFALLKEAQYLEDLKNQSVMIHHGMETFLIEVEKGKSILEAGLDSGIELPYSCQTGNCSMCRGTLIKGQVRQTVHRHKDLEKNEYQLCCTYPLSDDIELVIK